MEVSGMEMNALLDISIHVEKTIKCPTQKLYPKENTLITIVCGSF